MLEILFHDDHFIAINKPPGLLVHRSPIAKDATEFAVQMLRDQTGNKVYPCHRLDRKTSGVLLFALDENANSKMQRQFADKALTKSYLAIVRGFTDEIGTVDYPLKRDDGKLQDAITHYKTLAKAEIDVPFGKHPTSRYSLVEVQPETGRMHQIRKHFAHILHPIIGDRPYGCNKQNRLFKHKWKMTEMMLHATSLSFNHPIYDKPVVINAGLSPEFIRMTEMMGFSDYLSHKSDNS